MKWVVNMNCELSGFGRRRSTLISMYYPGTPGETEEKQTFLNRIASSSPVESSIEYRTNLSPEHCDYTILLILKA
jgi:hypothetical protein